MKNRLAAPALLIAAAVVACEPAEEPGASDAPSPAPVPIRQPATEPPASDTLDTLDTVEEQDTVAVDRPMLEARLARANGL